MARVRQFYGGDGAPLHIDGEPDAPSIAWRSHRTRLRAWLHALPDREWTGATRCDGWDVTALVRHLASGSQFLGYTLHRAASGVATSLLADFDSHKTVEAAAALLGDLAPGAARAMVDSMDGAVDKEFESMREIGWAATAEAPPGHVAAPLAVNHFLFDSWVHEYDLMVPRGEQPALETAEAATVAKYVLGLAALATSSDTSLDVRLHDPDLRIGVHVANGRIEVSDGPGPRDAAVIEGNVVDVVDHATGRTSGPVQGDGRAMAVLDGFAVLLAE